MIEWLQSIGAPWIWLTLGVLLAAAEMIAPGVYLLWLGLAAIATGALAAVTGLPVAMQVLTFVFVSLILAYSARRFLAETPIASADPLMNRRGARMVGQTALVTHAIEHGSGRVKHGDSEWIARGPAMAAGQRVRIVGCEGATLLVEPVEALEAPPAG
jgi:membrane protein implicated in regulation of membrane protease activity